MPPLRKVAAWGGSPPRYATFYIPLLNHYNVNELMIFLCIDSLATSRCRSQLGHGHTQLGCIILSRCMSTGALQLPGSILHKTKHDRGLPSCQHFCSKRKLYFIALICTCIFVCSCPVKWSLHLFLQLNLSASVFIITNYLNNFKSLKAKEWVAALSGVLFFLISSLIDQISRTEIFLWWFWFLEKITRMRTQCSIQFI